MDVVMGGDGSPASVGDEAIANPLASPGTASPQLASRHSLSQLSDVLAGTRFFSSHDFCVGYIFPHHRRICVEIPHFDVSYGPSENFLVAFRFTCVPECNLCFFVRSFVLVQAALCSPHLERTRIE